MVNGGKRFRQMEDGWYSKGRGKGGNGAGGGGTGGQASGGRSDWGPPLVGPRTPHWSCSGCSFKDNWASRARCIECGDHAPHHVAQKAIREDKLARENKQGGVGQAAGGEAKQLREENARIRAENAKLKSQAAGAKEVGDEDKPNGPEAAETEGDYDVATLESAVEWLKGAPKGMGDPAKLAEAEEKLRLARERRRQAQPEHKQVLKVTLAANKAKAAMEKAQQVLEAAEEAIETARQDLLAKHRSFVECDTAKKQLLAKLGGEAAAGGLPLDVMLDPCGVIDVVVGLAAVEAGKAGLPQNCLEAIELLKNMLAGKKSKDDKETEKSKDEDGNMEVDGGAGAKAAGLPSAASAGAASDQPPPEPPASQPDASGPRVPAAAVPPAAVAAFDQWTFGQCELAYAKAGVAGRLLAAKNMPQTATYTSQEVVADWRANGWKGSLAACRQLLASKKARVTGKSGPGGEKGEQEDPIEQYGADL